jgi:hypothetical protein
MCPEVETTRGRHGASEVTLKMDRVRSRHATRSVR